MTKSNNIILLLSASILLLTTISCSKTNEEPEVNHGYKTTIRVPDPEPLSPEDSALVAAQQKEYDLNKSKKN